MGKDTKYYFELLSIYSNLEQKSKDKIFVTVLKNEQRNLSKKNETEKKICELIDSYKLGDNTLLLKRGMESLFKKEGYICKHKYISYENFVNIIIEEVEIICRHIKNEKIKGIALALFLDKNNILPFIWYAFDKTLFIDHINKDKIIYIIQLSISYLYRLIEINIDTKGLGKENGAGAYCKILIHNKILYKVPLNYAALFYANINEWNMYEKLLNTGLSKYIPKYFGYHNKSGIIEKEYILGNTGEQILIDRGWLSEEEKERLIEIYNVISEVCVEKKVLLDIHPNNFVWNVTNRQWYLVDLGENQYIGSDYYILNDFKKYYRKSWLEREVRKRKYPIRSVLL